ncbi:MAG: hypothetical protein HOU81_08035 [Hamadaea sp.]|uniref:DUF4350 domain-containing protein n=1 Tax=Hamadaea sp. TaxID=2024425 RepID=UPI0017FDE6AA|nr:DUF4350 domain-containing protein [Hamadaea sp.]NUR70757.1 hypothetical protein [Hamadaea sp.]NUT23929.1 hypothetical protein [Hamadaea sp.]
MTAVLTEPAPAVTSPVKKKRRWHRIAIPFGVVLALVVATLVFHLLNEPDTDDPAFLSPVSSAALGSATLADRLTAKGVRIERQTRTSDALLSAYQGNATLLIPLPELMHRDYLRMLRSMPSSTRVVLIEPDTGVLTRAGAPVEQVGRRWATAVVAAGGGCAITGLANSGLAAALHSAYAPVDAGRFCYEQGVVEVRWNSTEFLTVGSADPFRNDRIDEYDNFGFALGLLAQQPKLVWLDVHETEPGPKVDPNASPGTDGVPPSLAPGGSGYGDGTGSGSGSGTGEGSGEGSGQTQQGSGEPSGQPQGGAAQPDPPSLFDALPPWFWATLAGLAVLVVLLAVAAARRLGPPVPEPLPFRVRGAETVLGRARLYQRAGAMLSGAQTLRRTVGPQIAVAVGLPPTAEADELAAAIAAQHGGDPADYLAVLADDLPKKDADLVALAARLDALLALVTAPPRGENRG